MNTVELFAGIGGFRLASDHHGMKTVWANDICPKACKVYRDRFGPDSIREGDVRKLLPEVPPHELLTGGFPCQPFSSAGKKQGIKDPRGTLFSVVVETLQRHRPRFFVLENVKRLLHMEKGVHFATILASLAQLDYLIEWRLLNAMHFGLPQNRQRVFIIGVRIEGSAAGNGKSVGALPIRLATPEDVSCLAQNRIDWIRSPDDWTEIGSHGVHFPNWGLARSTRFVAANLDAFSAARPEVSLKSVLQEEVPSRFDFTASTLERIGDSIEVNRFVDGVEILSNQKGGARMGYTVFGINGIAPTLTSTASRHYERYKVGNQYRRLTNVEYARIQGFPENHCQAVSVYDQYALFGNAVPPPMAEWVVGRLVMNGFSPRSIPRNSMQKELFADAFKEQLRALVRDHLTEIAGGINAALRGNGLARLKGVLSRLGRGGVLPYWFDRLARDGTLPNLQGKTIGSVIEMLLVAILETDTFQSLEVPPLAINPARGVDLPDLDLGVKSPSKNYCTSEPFFSAYERLLGSEHDMVVLLTDYQAVKETNSSRLQIIGWRYLTNTQVADVNLCRIARANREWLVADSEARAKKVFRFLAYINQSDWLAKQLLRLIEVLQDENAVRVAIAEAMPDFESKNREFARQGKLAIPERDIESWKRILEIRPVHVGVTEAADNWVIQTQKEAGRAPNENEWQRLLSGPLDGQIGMSFALQWRYNFGRLFNVNAPELIDEEEHCD